MIASKLFRASPAVLQSKIEDILGNANSNLGDVILVSSDRKYFLAHRMVLVSVSDILATVLSISCESCDNVRDEHVVLFLDQISGNILQNFLALIYTGVSVGLTTLEEVSELKSLCHQFQLKSFESLTMPISGLAYLPSVPAKFGFKEIEPPVVNNDSLLTNFMHLPKHTSSMFDYDGLPPFVNCATILKTEPEDISYPDYYPGADCPDNENGDYYEDPMEVGCPEDAAAKSLISDFFGHTNSLQEGQVRKFAQKGNLKPNVNLLGPIKSEIQQILFSEKKKKSLYKNIPAKKENDRWYCLTADCESKGQSFKYIGGLREHFMKKHATEDQKHFPCQVCGKRFGTVGLRNRHHQKSHKEEMEYGDSSSDQLFDQQLLLDEHGIPSRQEHDQKNHQSENGEYKCSSCNEKFSQQILLVKHQEFHCIVKTTSKRASKTREQILFSEKKKKSLLKNIPSRNEDDQWYCLSGDCEAMGVSFRYIGGLREHYMKKHATEDEKHFPCDVCGKRYGTFGLKNRHQKTHENVLEFACSSCDQSFDQQSLLDEHIMQFHPIPSRQENDLWFCLSGDCESKDQSFKYISALHEHFMEEHAPEDQKHFPCKVCGKLFGTFALQNKHQKTHHTEMEEYAKYQCSSCDKKFRQIKLLDRHMKTHSTEPKQKRSAPKLFQCDTCGKSFHRQMTLHKHLLVHSEDQSQTRQFFCDQCGKVYKFAQDLREHKERHSDTVIPCELCDMTFKGHIHYRKHFLYKHRLIHECHICHKKFSYQSVLKTHLAGHTGERPYVCDICGASYQGQSSLNSHIASVHEKRQRVKDKFCTMCEKAFYTNSKLKLHMSYHTEERNHVCDECGKSFKVKQHLMHHMESHGNINIQCQHCDRMFSSQSCYQKHLRRKHHL